MGVAAVATVDVGALVDAVKGVVGGSRVGTECDAGVGRADAEPAEPAVEVGAAEALHPSRTVK